MVVGVCRFCSPSELWQHEHTNTTRKPTAHALAAQVGNLLDIIGSRPKNRVGYPRHLVGSKLHVVLAMVPEMDENSEDDAGFSPRSLRRIIDELVHEVCVCVSRGCVCDVVGVGPRRHRCGGFLPPSSQNFSGAPFTTTNEPPFVALFLSGHETKQSAAHRPAAFLQTPSLQDHGIDNESLWVVVMAPCPPSVEVLSVIRSPRFMSRIIYYRGSVMDPMDMKAVCAE